MLTGEISINNQTAVRWAARRKNSAPTPGYSLYEVEVKGTRYSPRGGIKGDSFFFQFNVPHNPDNGLYALTSIIMLEIEERLTPPGSHVLLSHQPLTKEEP